MEFEEAFKIIPRSDDFTERDVLECLFNAAKNINVLGCIVEIGSYHGRSAIALALGSNRDVYCVDLFAPFKNPQGHEFSGEYVEIFFKNIKDYNIHAVKGRAEDVAKWWDKPIALLFIDGDHIYQEVKKDFEMWIPLVVEGGFVMLHDTRMYDGPKRIVKEKLSNVVTHQVGNSTWFIKNW